MIPSSIALKEIREVALVILPSVVPQQDYDQLVIEVNPKNRA